MADTTAEHTGDLRAIAWRAALLGGLLVAIVAAVLWLPALQSVRDRFADTEPGWVAATFTLQIASTLCFVAAFRGAFERRIGWRAAFDLSMVEAGANIMLPSGGSGGLAIGAVLLVRAGVPTGFAASRTAVLFLVTSAVSFAALILGGVGVASGVLPADVSLASAIVPAACAAVVAIAAVVLPRRLPLLPAAEHQRVRWAVRRVQRFLAESVDLSIGMVRRGDPLLLGGALGWFAFDVASMAASFRALGGSVPVGVLTIAYVLGHGGALLPLPGSAEGGLVGMLAAYGSPAGLALAAVLVYRTFHAGVPVVLGAAGYADIRRLRRHRPPPEEIARRFA